MSNEQNKQGFNPIIVIFIVQVTLVALLAILFLVGRTFDGVNIGSFFFAIIVGAIGASIATLKMVKTGDFNFKKEYSKMRWWTLLMPILYGVLLSGVCYMLFMSGILSGDGGDGLLTTNLFPNFSKTNVYNDDILSQFVAIRPSSMQDTGKLLVWSFLSGYSEKFVFKILNELEKK